MNNIINQKFSISKHQKLLSLNLHMLKQMIEESKIINMIDTSVKQLEKGIYVEIRSDDLDNYIKKILFNIVKVEDNLKEFMLSGNIFSVIYNLISNDMFGSLNQLKVELISKFNCEEVKITTNDKNILDGY